MRDSGAWSEMSFFAAIYSELTRRECIEISLDTVPRRPPAGAAAHAARGPHARRARTGVCIRVQIYHRTTRTVVTYSSRRAAVHLPTCTGARGRGGARRPGRRRLYRTVGVGCGGVWDILPGFARSLREEGVNVAAGRYMLDVYV
jgi:hypothetical protein